MRLEPWAAPPKLQTADGERRKRFLYVAIDRRSRSVHLAVKDDETEKSAIAFLREAAAVFPFQLTHVLTDNGSCFTQAFAKACADLGAQYRHTKPRTPQTNGMVERFNSRISSEVLDINIYSHRALEQLLRGFNAAYNTRRQRVLDGKTPDQVVAERLKATPTLAKGKPHGRAGPCDTTKARLVAEAAKEVSQPDRPPQDPPYWARVLVLVAGAVLAPGKRTVNQALRVMGLAERPGFGRYHDVLSRARWSGRAVARALLVQVPDVFLPAGEVVVGVDDTIERRWGPKITARGIHRDPVRSSRGHFVRASGLRWLSLMVMVPIPWANRRWALAFLTVLAPPKRWSDEHNRPHKTVVDWARQVILQIKRWLPDRHLIVVADASFAAIDLIAALRRHVCLVTRLRIDASLFAPAPPRRAGQRGRP